MKDITKYQGVIPAFYACYDEKGEISTEGVKALTRHLISKGVKGVYVGGSSGECIYQHVDERKKVLSLQHMHRALEQMRSLRFRQSTSIYRSMQSQNTGMQ